MKHILGLGLSLGQAAEWGASADPSLDFSALPNLPVGQRSSVTTAANTAATALSVTAQSVVDALAACSLWLDRRSCFTDTGGTVAAVTGDPIVAVRDWISGILATQGNASNRPTVAIDGITFDGVDDFLTVADQAAVRLGSNRGILVRYRETNGFRILQKKNGTGLEADSYFMSPASIAGVAGAFATDSASAQNIWTIDSLYWNGTVVSRFRNSVKQNYVTVTNGTVVNGDLDPTAIYADNIDSLAIGKRINTSGTEGHITGKISQLIYFSNPANRTRLEAFVNAYQ